MLSRNLATAILALSATALPTLARPQLAREPSLGYAAPNMVKRTDAAAPSLDVSIALSVKPELSATSKYGLYPVWYLADDPSNVDKKVTVNDQSGYTDVEITPDATSPGAFQIRLPSSGVDKSVLAYDETKGSLGVVPASTIASPLPWKILCSPTKGAKSSPDSSLCALYFAGESARCAVKATGGFAIDAACDASKAKAPQLWEIRPRTAST